MQQNRRDKRLPRALAAALAMLVMNTAGALTVPFLNTPLGPNFQLQANYAFGPHNIIFCFSSSTLINSNISWPLHGSIHSSNLPVLLKHNANFEGFFADPRGVITIHNTTGVLLQFSCVFGY